MTNNNNYDYDDTKKISYNDSYEDMKKYSTYPTKDKKYVCQTGQFKGFFVESVEFCKLKIAEGPPGPTGATGPQGLQGPIQGYTRSYRSKWNTRSTRNRQRRIMSTRYGFRKCISY